MKNLKFVSIGNNYFSVNENVILLEVYYEYREISCVKTQLVRILCNKYSKDHLVQEIIHLTTQLSITRLTIAMIKFVTICEPQTRY